MEKSVVNEGLGEGFEFDVGENVGKVWLDLGEIRLCRTEELLAF